MSGQTTSQRTVLRLSPQDNVLIACRRLSAGDVVSAGDDAVTLTQDVPAGHKVAVRPIARGDSVLRYGQIIGFSTAAIEPGEHVHSHNLEFRAFERDYAFGEGARPTPTIPAASPGTFEGIVRADGRVATRNYIGLLTSVNCSATVAGFVADAFRPRPFGGDDPLAEFPNVDGVVALTHKGGCCVDSQGEGLDVLRRTIAGFARHPNFSHVLILGLGCETNQIDQLIDVQRLTGARPHLPTMTIQAEGGTRKTVERAVATVRELLPEANRVQRQPVPLSHLTVALQCGGSDGYSGITANPALGVASDLIVAHGGSVILAETPESYGAEHLLTRRAVSPEVGQKLVDLIRWWEHYAQIHGGTMDNNPTPGNKAGGLTTILEKSLGAIAKAGSTNLVDVLQYAEPLQHKGFNFMDSPGYDPVSITGEVASGANVVCFTTGRGSVYGCVPAPTLKLATNSEMARRMSDDMDIDCGGIIRGVESVEECGRRIFERVLAVASGEATFSEQQGFGESEFAPWPLGAVM